MKKCKVVDEDGKGLIKEHKGDCDGKGNSCAGNNSDEIKAKIETDGMNE